MNVNPQSNNITANNYTENKGADAVYTGIAGALMGGSAGALYGAVRKPNFDQFSKTAFTLLEDISKNDQKQLRKIADRLSKDPNFELTKEQQALLERFKLNGKTPKEIKIAASKNARVHDYQSINERLQRSVDKIKLHLQNIIDIPASSKKDSITVKEKINKYINEYASEFTGDKTFNSRKEAVSFFNKKIKAIKEFQKTVAHSAQKQAQGAFELTNTLTNLFKSKQNELKDSIITAFKDGQSRKYMLLGGFIAGIAAGITAFTQKTKVKEIYVPVKEDFSSNNSKSPSETELDNFSQEVDNEREIDD